MATQAFDENDLRIEWIAVKQLSVVWVEAQRPYRKKRAQKIADRFDFKQFDPVRVTLPNGNGIYHIVEGQHRTGAVTIKFGPDQKAPCIVLPAHDPATAAKLFDGINGLRWKVDPVSTFKVRLTAEEKTECDVNRILTHRGYRVGSLREGSRNINAVNALIEVYDHNGPKVLDEVLQILSATWPSDPQATSANLLRGYGQVLGEFGSKVNWGHLKQSVATKYTPGSLVAVAKQLKDAQGGSLAEAVASTIVGVYNKGVAPDKKLMKKTST